MLNLVSNSAKSQNANPNQPKCTLAGGVGFQTAAITKHTNPNTNRINPIVAMLSPSFVLR
jgi:hypothetical protein